jgi:hypothetical protein
MSPSTSSLRSFVELAYCRGAVPNTAPRADAPRLTVRGPAGQSGCMASKKVRPTPPPGGPALVRPALGVLLLGLSGVACGDDDGITDTANDSVAPMPAPTSDGTSTSTTSLPPMVPPTTDDGADTGSSTSGTTNLPPMPDPTTGDTTTGDTTDGTDSDTLGPMPPPMPPPDGDAPHDPQEI